MVMSDSVEKLSYENELEDGNFEDIGLDPRLMHALTKKDITKPTPIQHVAIPLILEGKDVVARAKTGTGKTYAYLLPLLQKLFSESGLRKSAASAIVLVPTRELCQQVYAEALSLIELCKVQLKVVQLASSMQISEMKAALVGPPDILVATPACISTCFSKEVLQKTSFQESLSILVLDEADLLFSYGYEDDLKALAPHVPRRCQCLLMSATSSDDVEKLKKLVLHNPYILTLPEVENDKDEIIPKSVQQFYISCSANDKLVYILALLKLELVQKKVLIFVNSIDMGYKVKLFLEKFGIRSAVLNAELPQNSRLHILEEFNAGLFDYLIATDDSGTNEKVNNNKKDTCSKRFKKCMKQKLDSEFGVVRGIDFKNVYTVINFDMPQSPVAYVHRIGRTGRGYNTGASVSLVSADEMKVLKGVISLLGDRDEEESSLMIDPFPSLTQNAVDSLRYRAEDIAKSVTKIAVRECRAQDLRNEIINSEKLKVHFKDNPRDLDLLKHDKVLSKQQPPSYLRHVPEYLVDPKTQEASKNLKLARAAMGKGGPTRRLGLTRGFRKIRDPLRTFSAEARRKSRKSGKRREGKEGGDNAQKPRKKAKHL